MEDVDWLRIGGLNMSPGETVRRVIRGIESYWMNLTLFFVVHCVGFYLILIACPYLLYLQILRFHAADDFDFYLLADLSLEPIDVLFGRLEQEAFAKVWI